MSVDPSAGIAGRTCAALALATFLINGCVQMPSAKPQVSAEQAATVAVFEATPAGAVDRGEVTISSCLNKLWDARPGWEIALDDLKVAAVEAGANAISEVAFEDANTLFCTTGLKAHARAIVATPESLRDLVNQKKRQSGCDTSSLSVSDFISCKIDSAKSTAAGS